VRAIILGVFKIVHDEAPAPRDRRSLGTAQKPSGVLVGHTEGITTCHPRETVDMLFQMAKTKPFDCGIFEG
jgi:hypothetical protein